MRVLALDTALGACSVALLDEGKVRARRYQDLTRGHAEVLMGLVSEVEEEAGLRALECDRLGVTIGPGTFTGLRVGLAAARGLALATGLPLVGITTLQAIAANVVSEKNPQKNPQKGSREGRILALLDARRGEVYGQLFEAGQDLKPLTVPRVLTLEAAEALTCEVLAGASEAGHQVSLIGTGAALVATRIGAAAFDLISDAGFQPVAGEVARLASQIADPSAAPPDPLYLRAPDAKVPSRNPLD